MNNRIKKRNLITKNSIFVLMYLPLCLFANCKQNSNESLDQIANKEQRESILGEEVDSLFIEKLSKKELLPFKENNKIGFKNKSGNIIMEAKYDVILGVKGPEFFLNTYGTDEFLDENVLIVGNKSGEGENGDYLFGLIDIKGNEIIKPSFQLAGDPSSLCCYSVYITNGLLGVYFPMQNEETENRPLSFVSPKGEIFNFPTYTAPRPITDNLIRVEKNRKYGVVTKDGQLIIPVIYDGVQLNSYSQTLLEVCNGCRQINSNSEETCGSGDSFEDNFVSGKHGLLDKNGNIVVPLKYEAILLYNKIVLLNSGGKIKTSKSGVFSSCEYFSGGEWILYNPQTNVYSQTNYKSFRVLYDSDFLAVSKEDSKGVFWETEDTKTKWGVINEDGEEILPVKYSEIHIDNENKNRIIAKSGTKEEIFLIEGKSLKKIK